METVDKEDTGRDRHMTSQSHQRNPYDFVRLENEASDAVAHNFMQATNYSGTLEFQLHALTPIVINQIPPSKVPGQFARLGNHPVIPATSLKGMIRSVYEVVTNSNLGILKHNASWLRHNSIPASYRTNHEQQGPTPAEAMFGTARDDAFLATGAGCVLFRDITIPSNVSLITLYIPRPRGGPRPQHRSFYFRQDVSTGQMHILGRKFYYHQPFNEPIPSPATTTVEAIPVGTKLVGSLQFIDLTKEELDSLVYALVLEWDEQDAQGRRLAHKLGYGKPLGLGSVRLSLQHIYVEMTDAEGIPERFWNYDDITREDWIEKIEQCRQDVYRFWNTRNTQTYADFVAVTRWQETERFSYPSDMWFKNNSKVPLWEYQERQPHEVYPGDVPPELSDEAPLEESTLLDYFDESKRQVVDLRPIGQIEAAADGEPFVRGIDDKRYLLTAESAPRAVLRELIDDLHAGKSPKVRYRPMKQKINKKNRNVALDVEPLEGAS
jgi:hypothetical protein